MSKKRNKKRNIILRPSVSETDVWQIGGVKVINTIPDSWQYTDDLEMLFLFYQSTDELLSEVTPDTYALPLHNALSLIDEIVETYRLLKHHNSICEYYSKYIPPIIDELLQKIEDDYLLKKIFGKRLDSIVTGFNEAKNDHKYLERWVDVFNQSCGRTKYRLRYQEEIVRLITDTKDKSKLLHCIQNFYITLINVGYSQKYLYTSAKNFFNNHSVKITSKDQIKEFLKQITSIPRKYNFLILMDMENIEYLDNISDNITISQDIKKVDIIKERKELCEDDAVSELFKEYDKKKSGSREHQKIEIVRVSDEELDPYKSAIKFNEYIAFLQTFKRYFIHHRYSKQVFVFLLQKEDGKYTRIEIPNKIKKRPYINQTLIDSRIKNILNGKSLGRSAFMSLAHALEMHADAFDSKNTSTLFRSLWTALETLFSNPSPNSTRDNVINSVLAIIQKTYILKMLRALYAQMSKAIDEFILKELNIGNFESFVKYFSAYKEDSVEMKKIYTQLSTNPLLRSRIFSTRKKLTDGKSILKLLDEHKLRIEWQLDRLYRIRNIATHLGTEISGADIAINHLHSYFDYIVNYMLCKSENEDFVPSISSLVFESKNDIAIHKELLKSKEALSDENCMDYLFGPDRNLIKYQFEY